MRRRFNGLLAITDCRVIAYETNAYLYNSYLKRITEEVLLSKLVEQNHRCPIHNPL